MDVNVLICLCGYIVFCLIWNNFGVNSQDFGYDDDDGPEQWGHKFHDCLGKYQSPINIETNHVVKKSFPPLIFDRFGTHLGEVRLENNGHTVMLSPLKDPKPTLTGGPLKGVYKFHQLHFHWGPNDTVGSENQIDRHSYPLEVHVVMQNRAFKSFEEAANARSGLAVLAFLATVSPRQNEKYDDFDDELKKIVEMSTNVTITNFGSLDDLTTKRRDSYFTYDGSLTTPPCSETVIWIEFENTVPLSKDQINGFRFLLSKKGRLTHNYRPVQPLNNRTIYYNTATIKLGNISHIVVAFIINKFFIVK